MGLFGFAKILKLTLKIEDNVNMLIFTKGILLFYLIGIKRQRPKLGEKTLKWDDIEHF